MRQTVFYFEQPVLSPLLLHRTRRQARYGGGDSDSDSDSDITDYHLDHTKLNKGWNKANGPYESEGMVMMCLDTMNAGIKTNIASQKTIRTFQMTTETLPMSVSRLPSFEPWLLAAHPTMWTVCAKSLQKRR